MRYSCRILEAALTNRRSRGKVRLVLGARQTGKSTLLRHVLGRQAVLVDLQDPMERVRFEKRPEELAQRLEALEDGPHQILIDEIQKVPSLLDVVQHLVDRSPRSFEFFITGSSARQLRTRSANLLPGRAHQFELYPLTLGERRGSPTSRTLSVPLPSPLKPGFRKGRLEDTLIYGDLPGVTREAVAARRATLEAYADAYLQEEIRQEALVRDLGAFAAFLELAARESGGLINLQAMSRTSGIPASTLKTYYQVLVDTFVGYWIEPFTGRNRGKVQVTPRFVFFDLGVRNAATGWRVDQQLLDTQGGDLLEQWVLVELRRRCGYRGRGHAVKTWRTRHGREVDAILETPKELIPIEVKWTQSPTSHDARHLEAFLDDHPGQARRGFVVCRCPQRLKLSDRITALPWNEI